MGDVMQISYTMNVDDYRAWNTLVLRNERSGVLRSLLRLICLAFLAFGWLLFFVMSLPVIRGEGWAEFPVGLLIINAILTLAWLFWDRLTVWYIVTTQSAEDRAKMARVHTISIAPEALYYSSQHSNEKTGWLDIQRIVLAKDHVFIFVFSHGGHAIPRRAFALDEAFRAFGKTVQGHWATARENPGKNPPASDETCSPDWQR
jgi:hypothetical protein